MSAPAAALAIAPEVCEAAKTQRWAPDEFLRTLIEAEIASRDESNLQARVKSAGFPDHKTLDEFKVQTSSVPQPTFDSLAGLEWSWPRALPVGWARGQASRIC